MFGVENCNRCGQRLGPNQICDFCGGVPGLPAPQIVDLPDLRYLNIEQYINAIAVQEQNDGPAGPLQEQNDGPAVPVQEQHDGPVVPVQEQHDGPVVPVQETNQRAQNQQAAVPAPNEQPLVPAPNVQPLRVIDILPMPGRFIAARPAPYVVPRARQNDHVAPRRQNFWAGAQFRIQEKCTRCGFRNCICSARRQ